MQHPHREHPGCRKTRGGVFQDEKCKEPERVVGRNVVLRVCRLLSHFLSRVPDVPGYSARASPLHPGQQLRRGPRLD